MQPRVTLIVLALLGIGQRSTYLPAHSYSRLRKHAHIRHCCLSYLSAPCDVWRRLQQRHGKCKVHNSSNRRFFLFSFSSQHTYTSSYTLGASQICRLESSRSPSLVCCCSKTFFFFYAPAQKKLGAIIFCFLVFPTAVTSELRSSRVQVNYSCKLNEEEIAAPLSASSSLLSILFFFAELSHVRVLLTRTR